MPDRAMPLYIYIWLSARVDRIEISVKMASQLLLKLRQIYTVEQYLKLSVWEKCVEKQNKMFTFLMKIILHTFLKCGKSYCTLTNSYCTKCRTAHYFRPCRYSFAVQLVAG